MDIEKFIGEWILISNCYDTERYLSFYAKDAVLDDPSVGRKCNGSKGIARHYESYFIGYKTQTNQVNSW